MGLLGAVSLDISKVLLGNGKRDVDGVNLIHHHQRCVIVLHKIPGLDQQCARPAVNRRLDGAIAQIDPGFFNGRIIRAH